MTLSPLKQSERYLLVIDVEATCCDDRSFPRRHTEIIEIGAVYLDLHDRQTVAEFQRFVRPVRHPQLTDFCRQLTTITQAGVDAAATFPEVLPEFASWFAALPSPFRFASWGAYDKYQFKQDCKFHRLPYPFPDEHLNLKQVFTDRVDPNRPWPMALALEHLNLPLLGTHHRGLDDARNISEIALALASSLS
ncbi:MAG: exonuclease domain-containing protein [Geitlerinemataceae cyanobacterium]